MRTIAFISLTFFLSYNLIAQDLNTAVISNKLLEKLTDEPDQYHKVYFLLEDQVNFMELENYILEKRMTLEERSSIVIQSLKEKANKSQDTILDLLRNSPSTLPNSIQSFWISNVVFAIVKKELISTLSFHDKISWIGINGPLEMEEVTVAETTFSPNGIEPGLEAINAPALWKMGYTGYGQLAFTNDTGVEQDHKALENKYRGHYAPLESTWFKYDSISMSRVDGALPEDCTGHGTHVTGTMMGLDRNTDDTIGVAFNSQWIGSIILCGLGTIDNVAAFQWAMDPDGDPNTLEDVPDVINNSWYDPSLDTLDCLSVYVPLLEALETAGIAVVYSAGNMGPEPGTITQPHNINVNLVNTFTVGALNGNSESLPIANFSSRGPSHCPAEGSLLIKPEVSAPGVSVRSARPNNTYGNLNGTSMAAPHVSGAILLLKEAFPQLTGKQLKEALYYSCTDLGNPGEDNTFGMGIINVEEAFNYIVEQGYEPSSPIKGNDVLLIDFTLSTVSCENEVVPSILIENAGSNPLTSFEVYYKVGSDSQTFTWNGNLVQQERTEITLPPIFSESGFSELLIELLNPNNEVDEAPLNNRLTRPIYISHRSLVEVQQEGIDQICEGSRYLLRGVKNSEMETTFKWFSSSNGDSQIAEGDVFLTDPILQEQNVYVSASYKDFIGPETVNQENLIEVDTNMVGIEFDAYAPFTLKRVTLFANSTGGRQILLKDKTGDVIANKVDFFTEPGSKEFLLNFEIPVGTGYRLEKGQAGAPFQVDTTSILNFPYKTEAVLSINRSIGDYGENIFPTFHNWEIEYDDPCERTEISLVPSSNTNIPIANFNMSEDFIDIGTQTGMVSFSNISQNAISWEWNFGNGITSNEESPTYTFEEVGVYEISLMVTNSENCSDHFFKTITVINSNPTSVREEPIEKRPISVFPNPVSDNLKIRFDLDYRKAVDIAITNIEGKIMVETNQKYLYKETLDIPMVNFSSGLYLIIVKGENLEFVERILKIE